MPLGGVFVLIDGLTEVGQRPAQFLLPLPAHPEARRRDRHGRQQHQDRERHDQAIRVNSSRFRRETITPIEFLSFPAFQELGNSDALTTIRPELLSCWWLMLLLPTNPTIRVRHFSSLRHSTPRARPGGRCEKRRSPGGVVHTTTQFAFVTFRHFDTVFRTPRPSRGESRKAHQDHPRQVSHPRTVSKKGRIPSNSRSSLFAAFVTLHRSQYGGQHENDETMDDAKPAPPRPRIE